MEFQDGDSGEDPPTHDPTAYGAHQSYGSNGNYEDFHYAMSAAAEYEQPYNESDDENEETYAS